MNHYHRVTHEKKYKKPHFLMFSIISECIFMFDIKKYTQKNSPTLPTPSRKLYIFLIYIIILLYVAYMYWEKVLIYVRKFYFNIRINKIKHKRFYFSDFPLVSLCLAFTIIVSTTTNYERERRKGRKCERKGEHKA
jgi:hypothetical protein